MQHLNPDTLLQNGKYQILRFIASGGFGCTYLARHVMLQHDVAIKEMFLADFCERDEKTGRISIVTKSRQDFVERLKRKFVEEAQALHAFNHPGIVRVTDIFEENGTAYYVMDYVPGSSLQQIIDSQGPLPVEKAVEYVGQVADAMQYVHDHNRLHLDIKPSNILISPEGRAVLIDFGVSKQYDSQSGQGTSTLIGMSPGYAPIEQMSNELKSFTVESDIYALSATLCALVMGKTPPSAALIASGSRLDIPASVPDGVASVIRQGMAVKASDRPGSMRLFKDMLKQGLREPSSSTRPVKPVTDDYATRAIPVPAQQPPQQQPPSVPPQRPQPQQRPRRNKTLAIVIAALLLIGGGIAAFLLLSDKKNQEKVETAVGEEKSYYYGEDNPGEEVIPEETETEEALPYPDINDRYTYTSNDGYVSIDIPYVYSRDYSFNGIGDNNVLFRAPYSTIDFNCWDAYDVDLNYMYQEQKESLRSSGNSITYDVCRDSKNFYVISGYTPNGDIYYVRVQFFPEKEEIAEAFAIAQCDAPETYLSFFKQVPSEILTTMR